MTDTKPDVVWWPGLLGTASQFNQDVTKFTEGNAAAVRMAVEEAGGRFRAVNYQYGDTDETRFGRFSDMTKHAVEELGDEPGNMWVMSSVGAVVGMQALLYTKQQIDAVMLMPVIDVMDKALKLGGTHALSIKNGSSGMLPIPVQSTEKGGQAGHFPLSNTHFRDPELLAFMSNPLQSQSKMRAAFSGKASHPIGRLALAYADGDTICDEMDMMKICSALGPLTAKEPPMFGYRFRGGHGDNRTEDVKKWVGSLIGRGFGSGPA